GRLTPAGLGASDCHVAAVAVESDVISRKVGEDSFGGCFERCCTCELWQVGSIGKCFEPIELDAIAAGGYVKSFGLSVVCSICDDVSGIKSCVNVVEVYGRARERRMSRQALPRLSAQ